MNGLPPVAAKQNNKQEHAMRPPTLQKPGLLCALALLLPACAVNVAPWERGILAKPHMALDGRPMETAARQHAYASKEASSGGIGAGGGGCGCN
jgi:hypothetical protein